MKANAWLCAFVNIVIALPRDHYHKSTDLSHRMHPHKWYQPSHPTKPEATSTPKPDVHKTNPVKPTVHPKHTQQPETTPLPSHLPDPVISRSVHPGGPESKLCADGATHPNVQPPPGAFIVDAKGGAGVYETVAAAADAVLKSDADAIVFIKAGTYQSTTRVRFDNFNEITKVSHHIKIMGETENMCDPSKNRVVLTSAMNPKDGKAQLTESSTLYLEGRYFDVYNLNISNTAGAELRAPALSTKGDNIFFYGCSLESIQDAWYAYQGTQLFVSGIIRGVVDTIAAKQANVIITNSAFQIMASNDRREVYLFAQGRESPNGSGVIFIDRTDISFEPGKTWPEGHAFYGRDWKQCARVILANVHVGGPLQAWNSAAFAPWRDSDSQEHVDYSYYQLEGPGVPQMFNNPHFKKLGQAPKYETFMKSDYYSGLDIRFAFWKEGER